MSEKPRGVHLATLAHAGRLWDVYMEQDGDVQSRDTVRARLRFSSPEVERLFRTAVVIIEPSWEEAVARARALDDRQLSGLLRSVLPEEEPGTEEAGAAQAGAAEAGAEEPSGGQPRGEDDPQARHA